MGPWVWGIETDFQGADIHRDGRAAGAAAVAGFAPAVVELDGTGSQKIDWFGTLRGRVGWLPVNSLLVYATGGLAYGHVQTDMSFTANVINNASPINGSTAVSNLTTRAGWTIGGGLEWMFAPNWTIKGEYLYYDLGHVTLDSTLELFKVGPTPAESGLGASANIRSEVHYNGSIARVGLNYKF